MTRSRVITDISCSSRGKSTKSFLTKRSPIFESVSSILFLFFHLPASLKFSLSHRAKSMNFEILDKKGKEKK